MRRLPARKTNPKIRGYRFRALVARSRTPLHRARVTKRKLDFRVLPTFPASPRVLPLETLVARPEPLAAPPATHLALAHEGFL